MTTPGYPAWSTRTVNDESDSPTCCSTRSHYSAYEAPATLVRYDTINPNGQVAVGPLEVMIWAGGDSLLTARIDSNELRKLASALTTVADTIDAHIALLADEMIAAAR